MFGTLSWDGEGEETGLRKIRRLKKRNLPHRCFEICDLADLLNKLSNFCMCSTVSNVLF